jgi:hypothetical protein
MIGQAEGIPGCGEKPSGMGREGFSKKTIPIRMLSRDDDAGPGLRSAKDEAFSDLRRLAWPSGKGESPEEG